ncbi:MAG: tyrosinase family protein [Rhizomicrobium sp.]
MHQTRRQFVGTTAVLSAFALAGARAAVAPGPQRQSLAAFADDSARVASLRKGIAAMKALPASDHRSWFFQAATHAYSQSLYTAELRRDPRLKTVDRERYWNKCPHFGQCSADFVIWHRAYLHYFERHLRDAAGDPTLALPYWDYTKPEQRIFPAIFAPEFLDPGKTQPNPLFHPNREKSFTRGLLEISANIGQAPKTVAAATFFHEVGVPGFGGDNLDSGHTQIGLLEQRPHNDIHLACGGVINSSNGAMAEITTAAFDPVFWVHHANIDRMWAEWASRPGKSWGPAPAPDWFDEKPWTFVDVDGSERTLSRRDAIGLTAAYDVDYASQLAVPSPPQPPPPPVASAAPSGGSRDRAVATGAAPVMAAAPAPMRKRAKPPAERELLADNTPIVVTPHNAGHRLFGEAAPPGRRGNTGYAREDGPPAQALDAPELSDRNARVLLELADISFKLVPSSGFAVFLDCAGRPAAGEPVGLIDIFGATHRGMEMMAGMHHLKATQRFDVTAVVRQAPGPFTLRVEPYDLLVSRDGKPTRGRADAVTIGSVRFVVLTS